MERGADDTRELRGAVESFTLRVLSAAAAKQCRITFCALLDVMQDDTPFMLVDTLLIYLYS